MPVNRWARARIARWVDRRLNATHVPPPYRASEEARRLHETLFVADLHADTLLWDRDLLARSEQGHLDLPRLVEGGGTLQAFTVVTYVPRSRRLGRPIDLTGQLARAQGWPARTWNSPFERALFQAEKLHDAAARSEGRLTVLKTRDDFEGFLERRRTDPRIVAGFLGLEGVYPLAGDLARVDALYDAGYRMVGLVHLTGTEAAGASSETPGRGLTDFGRALVRRLEERSVLIDLAHASPQAIRDVCAMATRPVVSSHGGVQGTCDNPRNLDDEAIKAIADTGGLIGIGYWPIAVCGTDPRAVARAIRYAARVAGADRVALGSDFDGTVTTPFDASGLVQVTEALQTEGFPEEDIRAVMGENVKRLLRETLPPASASSYCGGGGG